MQQLKFAKVIVYRYNIEYNSNYNSFISSMSKITFTYYSDS